MTSIGTPLSKTATRVMLLGSGELGKEVAIELQRFGVEVIAVDRYANAPAMQVAHRSHVIDMLDGTALRAVIEKEKPDLVVPEIEAIATQTLVEMERDGLDVIPTARAARLTMDREGIRRLAAETLGVPTSKYRFADTLDEFRSAIEAIGMPCVAKPVMSSSGKGQSVVRNAAGIEKSWNYAQAGGRAKTGRVIVEGFIDFEYEITLLTLAHDRRHVVLRAHRPSSGGRRLRRILATTTDEPRGNRRMRADRDVGHQRTRWARHLRCRIFRSWRRRVVQRGVAASPRHRHGHDDQPGLVRVRAARTGDTRVCRCRLSNSAVPRHRLRCSWKAIRIELYSKTSIVFCKYRACRFDCSVNRKYVENAGWGLRWRPPTTSRAHARKHAPQWRESNRASNESRQRQRHVHLARPRSDAIVRRPFST